MRLSLIAPLAALLTATPALAADPVHSVESEKPYVAIDYDAGVKIGKFKDGDAVFSWQEGSDPAFSHALFISAAGDEYEFRLVDQWGNSDDEIEGRWDITRNGVLLCNDCIGRAYGLDGSVGDYFKLYVGTPFTYAENWLYSGFITHRYDY